MKTYVVEAYGGPRTTDGAIAHFYVRADSAAEAVDVVRLSGTGSQYHRFEIVQEMSAPSGGEAGIVATRDGSYLR